MKDVRVPGIVWVVLLVVGVALLHENRGVLGISPALFDVILVGVVAVIKGFNLGTGQINQALDVIDTFRSQAGATRMRGSGEVSSLDADVPGLMISRDQIPQRPNPVMRWLVG